MNSSCNQTSLSFHCQSGELLWGQLHCICEGYFNRRWHQHQYDSPQSVPEISPGGTIKQRSYQYRCRAMAGEWQAKLFRTRSTSDDEPVDSGYIIYHSHSNPVEILRRCAAVGTSLDQTHDDRRIIYINRYDWSWHHDYEFTSKINRLLRIKPNHPNDENPLEQCFARCLLLIDADSAMDVVQEIQSNPHEVRRCREKVFICHRGESIDRVGLYLSTPNTEFELAWLIFDSDQPDAELIAIVYDGQYTKLDGQILLDQEDMVSWNEYELKENERARVRMEFLKKIHRDAEQRKDDQIRAIMTNRGTKTLGQLADEFIARGFTFADDTEIASKYNGNYNDFQAIADTIQMKLTKASTGRNYSNNRSRNVRT